MKKSCACEIVIFYLTACLGGAFGAYAVLRFGMFASAQTVNLITFIFDILGRDLHDFIIRAIIMLFYALGTAVGVLIPRYTKIDLRLMSTGVTAVCAALVGIVSGHSDSELVLVPIFFSMALQWSAFPGACGYSSTSIFMTNNFRQMVMGGVRWLCDRKAADICQFWFYLGVLGAYFLGCGVSFVCIRAYGFSAIGYAAVLAACVHALIVWLRRNCACEKEEAVV